MVDSDIRRVQDILATLNIQATQFTKHAAVLTVEEQKNVLGGKLQGHLTKNLFVKDAKKKHYLFVLSAEGSGSLKDAEKILSTKGLRLESAEVLESTLGVKQGCVSPLALVNDQKHQTVVVLDAKLADGAVTNSKLASEARGQMLVHPLTNEATCVLSFGDLYKFLVALGQPTRVVDFGTGTVAVSVDPTADPATLAKITAASASLSASAASASLSASSTSATVASGSETKEKEGAKGKGKKRGKGDAKEEVQEGEKGKKGKKGEGKEQAQEAKKGDGKEQAQEAKKGEAKKGKKKEQHTEEPKTEEDQQGKKDGKKKQGKKEGNKDGNKEENKQVSKDTNKQKEKKKEGQQESKDESKGEENKEDPKETKKEKGKKDNKQESKEENKESKQKGKKGEGEKGEKAEKVEKGEKGKKGEKGEKEKGEKEKGEKGKKDKKEEGKEESKGKGKKGKKEESEIDQKGEKQQGKKKKAEGQVSKEDRALKKAEGGEEQVSNKGGQASQVTKQGAEEEASVAEDREEDNEEKGKSLLGIDVSKTENFSEWYVQLVTKGELIEYYDIRGCYILRPWAFAIWEEIQRFFDGEIKKLGVKNAYFPLFVSKRSLSAEKNHIEGFEPEVAWVTKAGQSDLEEHIAIRPTSETVMYPYFKRWIRSHRDLPLKLNQWSNVVRWEFNNPTPFIRSREFLWQEGHTAFATKPEADEEVLQILELYSQVYQNLLAVPVIKGKKTEKEKFAGGLYTTTVEVYIPGTGRGVQGATSHCLGQNFADMFHIEFEDEKGEKKKKKVWQNSWGLTTRTIGVMVMVHGDDKGLVLPPRIAPLQVIIVPILFKEKDQLLQKAHDLVKELKNANVRADVDLRLHNPGFKFNDWELKGVPLRIELGPKDYKAKQVVLARRDTGDKIAVPWDALVTTVVTTLEDFQAALFAKAKKQADAHTVQALTWREFLNALEGQNIVLSPWCGDTVCEANIKQKSGEAAKEARSKSTSAIGLTSAAKALCMPYDRPDDPNNHNCVYCEKKATAWVLFGRSY